jgi:hypothetical protein
MTKTGALHDIKIQSTVCELKKLLKKDLPSPEKIHKSHIAREKILQEHQYKEWFNTRANLNTHSHYYATGAETKSERIVDDMFRRLDEDGGGTLDCGEIASLF